MELRPARNDEVLAVADLWLRSREASIPANPAPVHPDDEVRRWFREQVFGRREVWVADDGGVVVALLVLEDPDWIDQLHVDPTRTGEGIGSLLVDLAKTLRPDGLQLWTFQSNAGARRFYERHGFSAAAFTDGDNEEHAPDVRYEWRGTG